MTTVSSKTQGMRYLHFTIAKKHDVTEGHLSYDMVPSLWPEHGCGRGNDRRGRLIRRFGGHRNLECFQLLAARLVMIGLGYGEEFKHTCRVSHSGLLIHATLGDCP